MLISIYAHSARVSLLDRSYYSALNDLSKYYSLLKQSFGREEKFNSFYLTSGLYYFFSGYARERLPLLTPFFYHYALGNKEKGIAYIKLAELTDDWKINQEATYFLMKINFDVKENYTEAARYCKKLMVIYPENLLFQLYHLRISLGLNRVNDAKTALSTIRKMAENNVQLTVDERNYYICNAEAVLAKYQEKRK